MKTKRYAVRARLVASVDLAICCASSQNGTCSSLLHHNVRIRAKMKKMWFLCTQMRLYFLYFIIWYAPLSR
jgi:hypothetical protein